MCICDQSETMVALLEIDYRSTYYVNSNVYQVLAFASTQSVSLQYPSRKLYNPTQKKATDTYFGKTHNAIAQELENILLQLSSVTVHKPKLMLIKQK